MTESLEVRAKLYNERDSKIDGFTGMLDVEGVRYQLRLPQEVQENGLKKICVCSALKCAIENAQRNGGSIEEITIIYKF